MTAKDLVSNVITPLRTSDTGLNALTIMEDLKLTHLPIVNNEEFLGLVSQADLEISNEMGEALGNHTLSLIRPFVYQDQNVYDILRMFSTQELSILPVLDRRNNYLGLISLPELVQEIAALSSANNPGGVIVLELNENDYSLSEISRIVESNDAKVLSLYVSHYPDSTKMKVLIKLNKIDIRPVLQTLYRYNYNVSASYTEEEDSDVLKERFDSLMNFMNI